MVMSNNMAETIIRQRKYREENRYKIREISTQCYDDNKERL